MIDLGSPPILDVAIGLTFMLFVLSIVCSSICEVIAAIFKLRAKTLEAGLRALLGGKAAADEFYEDWRVRMLGTPRWKANPDKTENSRKPSYLAPSTAALVMFDTFAPDAAAQAAKLPPDQAPSADALAAVTAKLDHVEDERAQQWLTCILADARGDVDAVRTKLEEGFNDVMDRASGWYKRKVQVILFCSALLVAGVLNADTVNVADRLSRDDGLRALVVAQAEKAADAEPATTGEAVEEQIENARAAGLPLGWGAENVPDGNIVVVVLTKLAGIAGTAFALMFGAPFWFDVLGKFARVRSSGNRIGTPKDDALAPIDRDDRLKRSEPQSE